MAEFRTLRSSVLRLWSKHVELTPPNEIHDIIRFNEAGDQSQTMVETPVPYPDMFGQVWIEIVLLLLT